MELREDRRKEQQRDRKKMYNKQLEWCRQVSTLVFKQF